MMTRRNLLLGGTAGLASVGIFAGLNRRDNARAAAAPEKFEVSLTEEEWRARLDPDRFAVLRLEDTERAFSSPLVEEHRAGIFHCAGCENALYSSGNKFDSGTGWPSFWKPIRAEAVGYKDDWFLVMRRTEVHCARCGGHLGHVFDDGPPPTGKRHCINGLALTFQPKDATTG